MEKYLPAVCYYPTTIIVVDDNRNFLESLKLDLDQEKAFYRIFDDTKLALHFLTNKYKHDSFTKRCLLYPVEDRLEHKTIDIDVRAIHEECNNPNRFSEISVLIIDYSMPHINGFDFCEKLRDTPYKKILLTSEADEALAIRAFNEGIIDKFVRKGTADFAVAINQTINDLQKKYFHDMSKLITNCFIKNFEYKSDFLSDKVFIDFFEDVIAKLHAAEYYLMDSFGSFMFLDINGNPSWLVVKNAEEMQALVDFAESANTPQDIVKPLIERSQIPYFHTDDELQTPPQQWKKFFHPANQLTGKEVYYYALITDHKAYSAGNVFPFAAYLNQKRLSFEMTP